MEPFPDVLRLEPVGKCNFKCIHCTTGTQPNNRLLLSREQFVLIRDQYKAAQCSLRVVVLYHGGEPLLNPDLAYFIHEFKKMGVQKTVLTTNASLLNKKRAEELIIAGLDEIRISFDGESAEENDIIRKNASFYKDALNVKALFKLRKRLKQDNPKIRISNIRICDKNLLNNTVTGEGRRRILFKEPPRYLKEFFKEYLGELELRSVAAMVWPGYKEQFAGLATYSFPPENPDYCGPLFETFTILSNGDVVPCCFDLKGEIILGNVFKESIFDIWTSPDFVKLRADFRSKKYCSFCSKCNMVNPRYIVRGNKSSDA